MTVFRPRTLQNVAWSLYKVVYIMKEALIFACCIIIIAWVGFWVIPKIIDFIFRMYETNSLFDLFLFVTLIFAIFCIGDEK